MQLVLLIIMVAILEKNDETVTQLVPFYQQQSTICWPGWPALFEIPPALWATGGLEVRFWKSTPCKQDPRRGLPLLIWFTGPQNEPFREWLGSLVKFKKLSRTRATGKMQGALKEVLESFSGSTVFRIPDRPICNLNFVLPSSWPPFRCIWLHFGSKRLFNNRK